MEEFLFLERIHLMMEVCELNHGPASKRPQAVNYLCQEFESNQIRVPVCMECEEALSTEDDKWVLLFCLSCLKSQWIDKTISNKLYHYQDVFKVKWMDECPHCYKGV